MPRACRSSSGSTTQHQCARSSRPGDSPSYSGCRCHEFQQPDRRSDPLGSDLVEDGFALGLRLVDTLLSSLTRLLGGDQLLLHLW